MAKKNRGSRPGQKPRQPVDPAAKAARDERRAEKRAAQERQRQAARRRRILVRGAVITGGLAAAALVIGLVMFATDRFGPDDIEIDGLREFSDLPAGHVAPTPVDYEAAYGMNPPAGGDHHQAWLNCGVYEMPQPNENAVHSLEHGAVWVTYDADRVTGDDLERLRDAVPDDHMIVSPYPGLDAPVVASAWGAQVELDGVDDERLGLFIDRFWRSSSVPEPGASCTGALDGPGRVR